MSKRKPITIVALLTLSALFSVLALAQSQSESPVVLPNTSLDSQGLGRYRVGPGDILDVRVFGQPDLNSTVEIDADGNISSLPFIETPIPAKCRDERDIQKSITEAYAKYIVKPRVSVRVLERRSRAPAVVYGAVRNAARFQMMRRVKLHELLASAGGITLNASGTIQLVHTEPELCPKEEGVMQTVAASLSDKPRAAPGTDLGQIEIYQINNVKNGLAKDDPYIRPGDIVIVAEAAPVYITGAVFAPREVPMKDGMTLARAIAMSGGVTRQAKISDVHIYRQKDGKIGSEDMKVNYEAIKKGQQPDVLLQALDIVEVRQIGTLAPRNWGDLFLNTIKGGIGVLPQRMIY
ncbi:MAG TPA: polysaccharide biosynthesis/export family protein [Pyrinomonadaceae bacterium]|nr:polysaccharide biosynthesis/export family protein [Pyrinomonadaceae bacterium]